MPHGLATRHRTAARVAAIKAPYPGVDTLFPEAAPRTDSAAGTPATPPAPADGDAGGRLAAVVHLADRTPRPARDGGTRHGQTAPIDAQNRVSLGKALSALDSDQQTGSCSPARCPRPRR